MAGLSNVCGNCRHWAAADQQSIIVGSPRQGECRWGPPSVTMLAANGQVVGKVSSYPPVHDKWLACGQFALQVVQATPAEANGHLLQAVD